MIRKLGKEDILKKICLFFFDLLLLFFIVFSGGVAQLGEHLPCKQGVSGSNPLISTNENEKVDQKTGQLTCSLKTAQ